MRNSFGSEGSVAAPTRQFYQFGPFRLHIPNLLLFRADEPVRLTPKALQTLLVLIRNQGKVVHKDQLLEEVWQGTFVEEGILSRNIYDLRKVLGDVVRPNAYIETIPKRGYRFLPPAELHTEDSGAKSIAVLPFRPIGVEPEDRYLGLGLADAVITRLSNVRSLNLRPTSAVSRFADLEYDAVAAGKQLAVSSVLEGVLRKSGGQVRLTLQLVAIPGGESLWSTKLDEAATDVFKLEDSVAEQVSAALMLKVTAGERRLLKRRYSEVPEAYHSYLKARSCLRGPSREQLQSAIALYRRAIQKDPQFALPYAGLAVCYVLLAIFGSTRPDEVMPKAKEAAVQALRLEPTLQEAREALAFVRWHYEFAWTDAESELRKLVELFPNDSRTHLRCAMLLAELGRFEEAIAEARQSVELDPTSPIVQASAGMTLYLARRYDQAVAPCRRALGLDPNCFRGLWTLGLIYEQRGKYAAATQQFQKAAKVSNGSPEALASLAHAYAVSGRKREAARIMEDLESASKSRYISAAEMVAGYAGLGDADRAFECLFRAVEERSTYLCVTNVDPRMDAIRSDPRFRELLGRIGLEPAGGIRASGRC